MYLEVDKSDDMTKQNAVSVQLGSLIEGIISVRIPLQRLGGDAVERWYWKCLIVWSQVTINGCVGDDRTK